MKQMFPSRTLALLLILVAGWTADTPSCGAGQPGADRQQAEQAVRLAVEYIVRRTREDGRFVYRINLNPDVTVAPRYNLLRHAGTVYSLCQFYRRHPEPGVRRVLQASTAFLQSQVGPVDGDPEILALWSRSSVTGSQRPDTAKLGGAGLALVALVHWENIAPGSIPPETLAGLGRFLCRMQQPDGSFVSRYIPELGGEDPSWQSLYYPGEAALGLVMLYELDGDRQWLAAAERALEYLARSRQAVEDLPHDHWALIATDRLLRAAGQEQPPVDQTLLIEHASALSRCILRAQVSADHDPRLAGAFDPLGLTAGCATRLEGLLAARPWLAEPLRGQVESAVSGGVAFLLKAQRPATDPARGAVPRALTPLPAERPGVSPQFNRRATEVRIDYQQHFISALLAYIDWQAQSADCDAGT